MMRNERCQGDAKPHWARQLSDSMTWCSVSLGTLVLSDAAEDVEEGPIVTKIAVKNNCYNSHCYYL